MSARQNAQPAQSTFGQWLSGHLASHQPRHVSGGGGCCDAGGGGGGGHTGVTSRHATGHDLTSREICASDSSPHARSYAVLRQS